MGDNRLIKNEERSGDAIPQQTRRGPTHGLTDTRIVAGNYVVIVVSVSWVVFVLLLCCINDGNGAIGSVKEILLHQRHY